MSKTYQQRILIICLRFGRGNEGTTSNRSAFPLERKWMSQDESAAKEPHVKNITWGDARPGNIIIGDCSDTWVIDFYVGFFWT